MNDDGRKATIKVEYAHPDWEVEIRVGDSVLRVAYHASLAEAMIYTYNVLAELFDIPETFDGCPEHHPRVKRRETRDG